MNFDQIKGSYLHLLDRIRKTGEDVDIPDFCASLQNTVTRHIARPLHCFYDSLSAEDRLPEQLVIGGGVAANRYIFDGNRLKNQFMNLILIILSNRAGA